MFDSILNDYIPAKLLREYLQKEPICDCEVADIIFYAKVSLQKKKEDLLALENMNIPSSRRDKKRDWLAYRESIEKALSLMESKEAIFIVYEYFLDEESAEAEEWMHGIFDSYNAVVRYIRKDEDEKKEEVSTLRWYVVDLWMKGEGGAYQDICKYYMIDGELCYAEFDYHSAFHESCTDGELRIPVHYKPGDILIADRYPFGRKVKFVMLKIGDNSDCCCLQALSLRKVDETWSVGAVKHGMIGDMPYPRISELYTAEPYHPDLSDPEDVILAKVSELVAGDERKGSHLWGEILDNGVINHEKMWDILTSFQK